MFAAIRKSVLSYLAFTLMMSWVWGTLLITRASPDEDWPPVAYFPPKLHQGFIVSISHSFFPLSPLISDAEQFINHRYSIDREPRSYIALLRTSHMILGTIFIAIIGTRIKEYRERTGPARS